MTPLPAHPAPAPSPASADGRAAAPAPKPKPLRASDEDRDRTAAALADALATGRLTADEHLDRLELAYAARTVDDLAPLTADLPDRLPDGPVEPPSEGIAITAVFSKVRRGGAWPVPPHSRVDARFGAVVLDLRQAVFTRREVTVRADSLFGKVEIHVPSDAVVRDTGTAAFGKRTSIGTSLDAPTGPIVNISGHSLFGHVRVVRW